MVRTALVKLEDKWVKLDQTVVGFERKVHTKSQANRTFLKIQSANTTFLKISDAADK